VLKLLIIEFEHLATGKKFLYHKSKKTPVSYIGQNGFACRPPTPETVKICGVTQELNMAHCEGWLLPAFFLFMNNTGFV
jgi:hypothetical protein